MKKTKILSLTALLLSLGMVGCNESNDDKNGMVYGADDRQHWLENEETGKIDSSTRAPHNFQDYGGDSKHSPTDSTCAEEGQAFQRCADCGYIQTVIVPKKDHSYVEDSSKAVAPTCGVDGSKTEVCSVCQAQNVVPVSKTGNHVFGEQTVVQNKVEGQNSKLSKKTCTVCSKSTDLFVDAMSYVAITGENRDATGATLKFAANGNKATYKFSADKAYSGCKVALYGYIDCWKDNNNNNDQKGHIYNGNPTFSLTVNGTAVEITNTQSFEQMGMTSGTNGNGSFCLCYVGGTADILATENTVVYERKGSYNLYISEIHFIAE